jgi:hypothetical protein
VPDSVFRRAGATYVADSILDLSVIHALAPGCSGSGPGRVRPLAGLEGPGSAAAQPGDGLLCCQLLSPFLGTSGTLKSHLLCARRWSREAALSLDSAVGNRFAERLLTVIASCRQQGRHLLEFLVAASEAALR